MTKNPTTKTASAPETRDIECYSGQPLHRRFPATETGYIPPANFRQLGKVCGFSDLANAYEQVTAQRDELLAIVKELKDSHDACEDGIGFLTNRMWVAMNAAIAKAERKSLIHDPERIEDAQIEARLDAIAEREDQIEQESSDE